MNVQNTDDFIAHLRSALAGLYRPMLGAVFTVATVPDEQGHQFLTGKVVFFDAEPLPARSPAIYPSMTLAEEQVLPLDAALQRLHALMSGETRIGVQPVKDLLLHIRVVRR